MLYITWSTCVNAIHLLYMYAIHYLFYTYVFYILRVLYIYIYYIFYICMSFIRIYIFGIVRSERLLQLQTLLVCIYIECEVYVYI